MKISVFTTATDPTRRGDLFHEPLQSYKELADEVIVVNGGKSPATFYPKFRQVKNVWPYDFNWPFIGEQFQRGYEAATGDWVIHADLDFVFHERDYQAIRSAMESNYDSPALSFWKYQFVLPDRYNLKSRLVIAVNKRAYGDRIRFDSGGDLCQPSLDGKELKPEDVPEARIPFYNYEKILKTKEQITDDVGRMARAWHSHFGEYLLGGPDDASAYDEWLKMTLGRFNGKAQEQIPLSEHPKVMQKTIAKLKQDQFGHSGFGFLKHNNYLIIETKEG